MPLKRKQRPSKDGEQKRAKRDNQTRPKTAKKPLHVFLARFQVPDRPKIGAQYSLRLPPELRTQIYGSLEEDRHEIHVHEKGFAYVANLNKPLLALLYTCTLTREEVLGIFYSQHSFRIHSVRALSNMVQEVGLFTQNIRRVVIEDWLVYKVTIPRLFSTLSTFSELRYLVLPEWGITKGELLEPGTKLPPNAVMTSWSSRWYRMELNNPESTLVRTCPILAAGKLYYEHTKFCVYFVPTLDGVSELMGDGCDERKKQLIEIPFSIKKEDASESIEDGN